MSGNDSNTMLLCHFDGTNGATSSTDSSTGGAGSPHALTVGGTVVLDTAQAEFGASSCHFQKSGGVTAAASADFAFGTSDFTIDFWARFNTIIPNATNNNSFIDASTNLALTVFYSDSLGLRVFLNSVEYDFAWTASTATWYHVALSRSGTNLRAFVAGTQIGATQTSGDNIPQKGISIGNSVAANGLLDGWMDEVRYSNIARWTSNFTPPTSAYSASSTTYGPRILTLGVG